MSVPPKLVTCLPSPLNVGSRLPPCAIAAVGQSATDVAKRNETRSHAPGGWGHRVNCPRARCVSIGATSLAVRRAPYTGARPPTNTASAEERRGRVLGIAVLPAGAVWGEGHRGQPGIRLDGGVPQQPGARAVPDEARNRSPEA